MDRRRGGKVQIEKKGRGLREGNLRASLKREEGGRRGRREGEGGGGE